MYIPLFSVVYDGNENSPLHVNMDNVNYIRPLVNCTELGMVGGERLVVRETLAEINDKIREEASRGYKR